MTGIQELRLLGFEPDLGAAMALTLSDSSVLLISSLDADGEPDAPVDLDAPAIAQRMLDPWDHDTLLQQLSRPTLRELINDIGPWIEGAL
jgi:hypothetical protein